MTVPIWLWVDLHRSRNWPWLHNVSTSGSLAKGEDYPTSHSGRRTFITKLADKGVGVRVLMALAGHKSIATTQRYIELNPTVMKAAVELI
jgi:integrase